MSGSEQCWCPSTATAAWRTCWWRHVASAGCDRRRPIVVGAAVDRRRQRPSRQSEISKVEVDGRDNEERRGQPGQEQHDVRASEYQPGSVQSQEFQRARAGWPGWRDPASPDHHRRIPVGDTVRKCALLERRPQRLRSSVERFPSCWRRFWLDRQHSTRPYRTVNRRRTSTTRRRALLFRRRPRNSAHWLICRPAMSHAILIPAPCTSKEGNAFARFVI